MRIFTGGSKMCVGYHRQTMDVLECKQSVELQTTSPKAELLAFSNSRQSIPRAKATPRTPMCCQQSPG